MSALWPPVIVALAYYVSCFAGFALRFPSSGISFFWPPTAVLAAALVLTTPRSWTALLAASFVAHAAAHAQDGIPIGAWPIQFLGNAAQAMLAAFVVRRFAGGTLLFADAGRVITFIVGACVLAPAVASLIPAYVYVSLGWASDFWQAWRARTVSNGVASLTLLPSLVIACQYLSTAPIRVPRRLGEYVVLLVGMFAVHSATASIQRSDVLGLTAALYSPAPFLLWATARFGGAGLSFALLWATLLTISNVSSGFGPLAGGSPADAVVGVQLLIAANAVPMMLIAGLLEQNRRELTQLSQSENALREANDALVRTGRIAAMAEFGASIAHELNQPLAAIVANAHVCLRSMTSAAPAAEIVPALNDIVIEGRRASDIIERTRDMFTNHPAQKSALNLNDSIRNVVEMARGGLRESNVLLELNLDIQLPSVFADAVQMQQVLLNLVVNGVEAMQGVPERARLLRISSRRRGNLAVVSVRDTGKGFESEHPERVFEPFYTTKAAGIGMGLTICRSIVKNHGGSLWAVANVDRGATFRFTLPMLEGRGGEQRREL